MDTETTNQTAETASTTGQPEQKPEKVTFDARQQDKVNELIREAQGRAAKEVRAELAAVREKLSRLEAVQPPSREEIEALERRAAEAKVALAEAEAIGQSTRKQSRLLHACQGFLEPELVATLLKSQTAFVDGELRPTNEHGSPLLNTHGEAMSLDEFVRQFGEKRPWMVRSQAKGGSGSVASRGSSAEEPRAADYFGPQASKSGDLHRISRENPTLYRRLRAEAVSKGFLRR